MDTIVQIDIYCGRRLPASLRGVETSVTVVVCERNAWHSSGRLLSAAAGCAKRASPWGELLGGGVRAVCSGPSSPRAACSKRTAHRARATRF